MDVLRHESVPGKFPARQRALAQGCRTA